MTYRKPDGSPYTVAVACSYCGSALVVEGKPGGQFTPEGLRQFKAAGWRFVATVGLWCGKCERRDEGRGMSTDERIAGLVDDDDAPVAKTCRECWATYEGWRSDSDLCPDCDFMAEADDTEGE